MDLIKLSPVAQTALVIGFWIFLVGIALCATWIYINRSNWKKIKNLAGKDMFTSWDELKTELEKAEAKEVRTADELDRVRNYKNQVDVKKD